MWNKDLFFEWAGSGVVDLDGMPFHDLEYLKRKVDGEMEAQLSKGRVRVIAVGCSNFYDKHFLEDDIERAREYAQTSCEAQIERGELVDVVMVRRWVHETELHNYLDQKGLYE